MLKRSLLAGAASPAPSAAYAPPSPPSLRPASADEAPRRAVHRVASPRADGRAVGPVHSLNAAPPSLRPSARLRLVVCAVVVGAYLVPMALGASVAAMPLVAAGVGLAVMLLCGL
jgi:hypothetical protein